MIAPPHAPTLLNTTQSDVCAVLLQPQQGPWAHLPGLLHQVPV